MNGVIYCSKSHRTSTCENCHSTAFYGAHAVCILSGICVIICMECPYNTAHRLCQAAPVESLSLIGEQAVTFHYFIWNNNISSAAANIMIGISGSGKRTLIVDCRLDSKAVSRMEFILPFLAHFNQFPAKLVPQNNRRLCNVVRHTFMGGALEGCLM